MSFLNALNLVPVFVLVFFRVAGMMIASPLFGSARVPRRVKLLFSLVLAMGLTPGVARVAFPETSWGLAVGIGGELIFGLALGTILSLAFFAAQGAGEIIGQQMGLNFSETIDPSFGSNGSLIGDMYFIATLLLFLVMQGHHAMLRGLRESFDHLPLLSVGMDRPLLDLFLGLLQSAVALALRLAAPMLLTMLVIDVALGFIGKTMPQVNVMSAGLSLRTVLGTVILLAGLTLSSETVRGGLSESMEAVRSAWGGMVRDG